MLKDVAGDSVVIARGPAAIDFNGVLVLNESCALLWKNLQDYTTIDKLAEVLETTYSIERAQAVTDVEHCITKMTEYELLDIKE